MPKQICHAHCPRGGGSGAVLVVLAVIVIAATARAVIHAAELVLEVAVIAAASVLGLAAVGGIALLVQRVHRSQARALRGISRPALAVQKPAETLSAPQRLAIEARRPSLADLQDLAAQHGYECCAATT